MEFELVRFRFGKFLFNLKLNSNGEFFGALSAKYNKFFYSFYIYFDFSKC